MITLPTFSGTEIAAGATLIGGVLVRLVDQWLNKAVSEDALTIRNELRKDILALRNEVESNHNELAEHKQQLKELQEELDSWREKYYSQVESTNELLFEVQMLKNRLRKYENDSGPHDIIQLDDET